MVKHPQNGPACVIIQQSTFTLNSGPQIDVARFPINTFLVEIYCPIYLGVYIHSWEGSPDVSIPRATQKGRGHASAFQPT